MIRVLQVVNDMHRAGLETMLMNYYRNIDRTQIQFDFLTHRPYRSDYDDEIENMGGKLYYAPRLYPQNYRKYFHFMQTFWSEHPEYKIVHSHIDSMSYLPLLTAKKANIPVRIAHSHNTSIDKDLKFLLKQFYRTRIKSVANYYCACGQAAGKYLFPGKEFTFIPNAIDEKRFVYNSVTRDRIRRELDLGSSFVIGHVGRFSYQKNHQFLIDIFDAILKIEQNSRLILIGVGEKETEIKKKVAKLGLNDKVLFLDNRNDVNDMYQAMDAFVLPSLFEGIPVVGIEAQFSGLSCYFSDKVPSEVAFTKNAHFINLKNKPAEWAKLICRNKNTNRITDENEMDRSIYSIENSAHILTDMYVQLLNENCNEKNMIMNVNNESS